MLGKRISRGRAFTMCHAILLTVFIALAHLMGPYTKGVELHLSNIENVEPNSDYVPMNGVLLIRASASGEGQMLITIPLCNFGSKTNSFSGEV